MRIRDMTTNQLRTILTDNSPVSDEDLEAVGNELDRRSRICEIHGGRDLAACDHSGSTPVSLASCGHPADEDGECSCSYWPERAPLT